MAESIQSIVSRGLDLNQPKEWLRREWFRLLVHLGALTPFLVLAWKYWRGEFLVDPVREMMTSTGQVALILLMLTLAATPINTLLGFKQALRVRRALGLYTFAYAVLHLFVFVGLDYAFAWGLIIEDIFGQLRTVVGAVAWLSLLPLAVTSTNGWMKRLGKRWKRLHRLVYLTGVLAVVHFLWSVKDGREPYIYGGVLLFLFVMRIPALRKAIKRFRRQMRR
jgi:sulfoxide reductase heme-binding subunit YedZ